MTEWAVIAPCPEWLLNLRHTYVCGIDPGAAKVGIAHIVAVPKTDNLQISTIYLNLKTTDDVYETALNASYLALEAHNAYCAAQMCSTTLDNLVVEGASHNERVGQDRLSQARFALTAVISSQERKQIPPMSVRKKAFLSGTLSGQDLWPQINPNAADAVGCALAALL